MATSPNTTIGILTGGGDVPGLNPCIKQLVLDAHQIGMTVLGIRRGWDGLVAFSSDDPDSRVQHIIPLDPNRVRTIDRSGGTILHTSRTNPSAVSYKDAPEFLKGSFASKKDKLDFTDHVLDNLSILGIDVLVAIGGDDTLSFAYRLHREGFPVIAIPKTMDNDVTGTDYCIGFSTAVTRSVNFIHALRTSSGSHERIAVVELFGRYCGETSLVSAYLAGVERCVISEVPFNIDTLCRFLVADRENNPSRYAMMTISEGAVMEGGEMALSGEADAFGHRKLGGIGAVTAEAVKEITGIGIIFQPLLYLMRSGSPDSLDLMVAFNYANMAVDLIRKKTFGKMVALSGGQYTAVDISVVTGGAKRVDVDGLYDADTYRPRIRTVHGKPMFLY
ncbi:MAG: 6-phosphofructokinase [Desulfosarcina sp.]|nr:6-phosphofructokinase [Desulfosarcina sp.]MBC2742972.1 6-phosphofructokinase [Desulfosarcina sp.]MBC2765882.1 phosphofructokinase [Desulfosarcina sp.]